VEIEQTVPTFQWQKNSGWNLASLPCEVVVERELFLKNCHYISSSSELVHMIVAYLSQTQKLMSNIWGSDNLWQLGFGYFEVKDSAMRIRVAEWMWRWHESGN
jgi:hypothetical protein